MKLIKPIYGVREGEIYPVWINAGETCPKELEAAAREIGAVQTKDKGGADGGKAGGSKAAGSADGRRDGVNQPPGGDSILPNTGQSKADPAAGDGGEGGGK